MATQGPQAETDRKSPLAGEVIVLLEDDDLISRATERMLRRFGAEVITATGSAQALALVAERQVVPNCVIADYWLSRTESGLAAAMAVCDSVDSRVRGFIITGDLSGEVAAEVAAAGFRLLRKPVNIEKFLDALTPPE